MANLYATINSDRSSTSRISAHHISTTAETWGAIVNVNLLKDGDCSIQLTDKHGNHRRTLWEGNIDETAKS